MKVRTIREFFDQKEKVKRKLNDIFIATNARAEEINSSVFGRLVEEVKEEKKKDKKKSGE